MGDASLTSMKYELNIIIHIIEWGGARATMCARVREKKKKEKKQESEWAFESVSFEKEKKNV